MPAASLYLPPFIEFTKEILLCYLSPSFPEKWRSLLGSLDTALGGVSSLLIMLKGVLEMIVLCTNGKESATTIFKPRGQAQKGSSDRKEQLYCQVALSNKEMSFIDDRSSFLGFERNENYDGCSYSHYSRSPWRLVSPPYMTGTIAMMEKVCWKLEKEHVAIV